LLKNNKNSSSTAWQYLAENIFKHNLARGYFTDNQWVMFFSKKPCDKDKTPL